MIIAYLDNGALQAHEIHKHNLALLEQALWIDLVSPSMDEENLLEQTLNLNIPTREEMWEIELSSRLYKNKDALFMTANMIAHADSPNPKNEAVTFVLTKSKLITVRYIEPSAFKLFIMQLHKFEVNRANAVILLIGLLEAAVDRFADILESIAHKLEQVSKSIFRPELIADDHEEQLNYQQVILKIGNLADLNTAARECLVSFSRLIAFFSQAASTQVDNEGQSRIATLTKDINSLSDHASFISTKVNFLLDATLGMINIEQNRIIKIFSVAAVIFLPPTLIASIYGMNFKWMPELESPWGYWLALSAMLLSAILPYKFFKYKKWL
ncbi:magnesium transporter CorA family protein [Legionella jordanis]|uniref:Magnesium transport protein CorA n=1 Tax=Legionella jordanis TaxID=456 RepID=A0A0W0VG62_9GAMM|nr:magnesium transporter CorA family protein [Legionella jordanis]KTD18633.1 magnesium and cobalt transport protein CorA [Legionella jordanis]RMX00857.1 magnesium transporter [Legionella jordanis]RMX17935.1 magnesium transporter [Legionella jordanis]VEH11509.1 magnesium and cobalt transport protein CorA [Legionella jordanis]HAT8715146.1 magnesium transporter [Legionella jordanis]